jgi:hypothetical protein
LRINHLARKDSQPSGRIREIRLLGALVAFLNLDRITRDQLANPRRTKPGHVRSGPPVQTQTGISVQQSIKVELVINMTAAKILGITFPTVLLVRADEVTERNTMSVVDHERRT